jgi:hypothetical protein
MEKELFTWEGLEEACATLLMFSDCTFIKDFGPIKMGDKFDVVAITPENSTIDCQTYAGVIIHSLKFKLEYDSSQQT